MYYHVLLTESMVAADPVLRQDDYHYTSVEEEFDRSMERSMKYVNQMKTHNMDIRERHFYKL